MRRSVPSLFLSFLLATPLAAQPVEFDPSDFGKIVVAPRQSAGSGIVLEQAFGDYQNEPVISYGEKSIARRLGRPVGRLDVLYENGKTGYCTAFIIDAEHLVTNNHCIPGVGGGGVQAAQFVAGYVDSAHPESAEKFQVSLEPLETSVALDYSVLRVFGDPSARYGKVELADADPEPSEFMWIIGHPQGQAQHISREGCAAGDPPVSTEGKVVHTCDTLGGNSGSPVFRISDRQVVALHHAGDSRTGFNFAIPITRILAESRILKATAAPEPPEPPAPPVAQGACEVLWSAAEQHGCLGYRTFIDQCAEHPLAPLARGLAERSCHVDAGPPPDPAPPSAAAPDAALQARISEALSSAEGQRARIAREAEAAGRAVTSLEGTLNRATARAGDAQASGGAGGGAVAGHWAGIAQQLAGSLSEARARAGAMQDLVVEMDAALEAMRGAGTEAELSEAVARGATLVESSRERLAYVSARKTMGDALFRDAEKRAVAILKEAVGGQAGGTPATGLRRAIDQALPPAQAAQDRVGTHLAAAVGHYAEYEALVRAAYDEARAEKAAGGPASAEIVSAWEDLARGLSGEARRVKTRADGMARFDETIATGLASLRDAKSETEVQETMRHIRNTSDLAEDWLSQIATRLASAREQFAETEVRVASLRAEAESAEARPPIVTRCLDVAMPKFAVEGIAGVSRKEFDADAAELACSAARKLSDDPAVHYGFARALIDKKRYGEAIRILENPRMSGFVPARYSLGVAYNNGLGVARNYDAALQIYRETTAADYPQGKFSLGVYYSLGRAVRADHAEAGRLLVESIADGYEHPITQLHKLPNATIREIQRELVARGLLGAGGVDGAFGPATRGSLERLAAAATPR